MTTYGDHLLKCEQHVCDGQHKKCPGFYCVPLRTVCDGKWNCPGGTDEENCVRISCPGLYRCHLSAVCINIKSICDNIADCPVHDDEAFCEHKLPACPAFCSCLLFSLSCDKHIKLKFLLEKSVDANTFLLRRYHIKVNIFY